MYKALVTYNFSDDDTRDSFTELLVDLGFENQPDQSTYALAGGSELPIEYVKQRIIQWSKGVVIRTKDCVQIYKPTPVFIKDNRGGSKIEWRIEAKCLIRNTAGRGLTLQN